MSWRLYFYSALLVFGIRASPQLTVWGLLAQMVVVFGLVFLLNFAVGETFAGCIVFAYIGIFFIQVGYFIGLLIEAYQ